MTTLTITVTDGVATLPDGTQVNLLEIQALLNEAFQDHGDNEFAAAANELSLITRKYQGPHGDWFEGTYRDA